MMKKVAGRDRKEHRMSDALRSHSFRTLTGSLILVSTLLLQSCTDRSRAFNAKLRDRIQVLEQKNESLEQERLELQQKLNGLLETTSGQVPHHPDELHPAVPIVTTIAIDPLSGRSTGAEADGPESLEIYVQARDGRGRPIQLAGSMLVKVTRIDETQPPRELAVVRLSPEEVREAWRAGMMGGPSWLVTIPLSEGDLLSETETLDVDVFYKDLRTGSELQCGDKVDIR